MIENIIKKSFEISPIAGILVCAVICLGIALIFIYKTTDKKLDKKDILNREFTTNLINDLKSEVKESKDEIKAMKEENKEDKKTLRLALETFDRTTKEFQMINSNLNEMKTDITVIKEKLK